MTTWKDPEIEAVRGFLAAGAPKPGAPEPSIAERRAGMDAFGDVGSLAPGARFEPITAGGVPAEKITPVEVQSGRTILYLHGGGYVLGSPKSHRPMVSHLATGAQATAVSIDYRLAPEHPFPAAVDDAVAAYRWLLEQGTAAGKIVIAGDSAGGGLTLAAALAIRDAGLPLPAGLFVISPWADLTQSSASMAHKADTDPMVGKPALDNFAAAYLAKTEGRHPIASPAFADYSGLPPILIHVGSEETLLGDALMVADRAGHDRVHVRLEVWPEMIHVWHMFGGMLSAGRKAVAEAGAWIAERTG